MTKLIVTSRTSASGSKKLTGFSLCWRRDISYRLRTNFLYIIYVGLRRLCHDSGHHWGPLTMGSPLSTSSTFVCGRESSPGTWVFLRILLFCSGSFTPPALHISISSSYHQLRVIVRIYGVSKQQT